MIKHTQSEDEYNRNSRIKQIENQSNLLEPLMDSRGLLLFVDNSNCKLHIIMSLL